jgi:hypothetical protein
MYNGRRFVSKSGASEMQRECDQARCAGPGFAAQSCSRAADGAEPRVSPFARMRVALWRYLSKMSRGTDKQKQWARQGRRGVGERAETAKHRAASRPIFALLACHTQLAAQGVATAALPLHYNATRRWMWIRRDAMPAAAAAAAAAPLTRHVCRCVCVCGLCARGYECAGAILAVRGMEC